mgnify:CR=1 FL=1|jgi:hypothetical protein
MHGRHRRNWGQAFYTLDPGGTRAVIVSLEPLSEAMQSSPCCFLGLAGRLQISRLPAAGYHTASPRLPPLRPAVSAPLKSDTSVYVTATPRPRISKLRGSRLYDNDAF